MRKILILGATSAVAEALARRKAAAGASLLLVGRDAGRLAASCADLRARGAAAAEHQALDLTADADFHARVRSWRDQLGGLDEAYLFYGVLGDQAKAETDAAHAGTILRVNFTSQAQWALAIAAVLEAQNHGTVLAVSSVAGDRGRASNYVYGAAKGGLTLLFQGLAHRFALAGSGARAVAVKMGFVISPMTEGMNRKGPLWSTPEVAAAAIEKAARKGAPTAYVPWFWWPIMTIIRLVPWPLFRKARL